MLVTGGPVLTTDSFPIIAALGARAAMARVTVHACRSTSALPGACQSDAGGTRDDRPDPVGGLRTGGDDRRSGADAGLGRYGLRRLGRELSAGYVLAFETESSDRDGKAHQIDVKVRDRGWGTSVRARRTFRADPKAPVPAPPVPAVTAARSPRLPPRSRSGGASRRGSHFGGAGPAPLAARKTPAERDVNRWSGRWRTTSRRTGPGPR